MVSLVIHQPLSSYPGWCYTNFLIVDRLEQDINRINSEVADRTWYNMSLFAWGEWNGEHAGEQIKKWKIQPAPYMILQLSPISDPKERGLHAAIL